MQEKVIPIVWSPTLKKIIAAPFTVLVCSSILINTSSAEAKTPHTFQDSSGLSSANHLSSSLADMNADEPIQVSDQSISEEDLSFIQKVADAGNSFVERDGKIATSATDQQLKDDFGFTDQQVVRLHEKVLGKPMSETSEERKALNSRNFTSYASVQGKSVCFSNEDLAVGAGAAIVGASEAGPAGIAAALEAAATAFGGPVGSVIGIILTAASAPSLIEIGGRAAKAAVSGQGLKIGVHADYPPVYADYC
ncbi:MULTISPECIES: hypothetical protein [Corynebacterium]|uniref:hypothetical protein n=1 Tax=Corynebacterium TaxID=1716 RepID=UPI001EF1BBA3|nr:hypothetical protein [Corynebacterium kefirresidentii]MCG7449346.1 hypothetical protein [Corynebacterium kefirresidentii]MCG7452450.1 hypothetical protein [Corynebacterium kefirresidentii]